MVDEVNERTKRIIFRVEKFGWPEKKPFSMDGF